MGWNGLDLVNDFSAELGDTSTAFKTKVLRWVNEGIKDIATIHNWPALREKGKAILSSGQDTHDLSLPTPAAPTLAALAGGSLTSGASYKVLYTYYESSTGVESIAGTASSSITPSGGNLSITVSVVAVSTWPLVTERRIYLSKNDAAYAYYGTISNNSATTTTITADTSSTVTPPEESGIRMIDGDPFIDGTKMLTGTSLHDLLFNSNGVTPSGTPESWAPVNEQTIRVYPKPSSNTTLSFYFYKLPAQVFGVATSVPQIPSWLKEDLRNYVMWRGYAFRDRAGTESMKLNYEQGIRLTISRKGRVQKRSGRVRCVTPDSDGYAI